MKSLRVYFAAVVSGLYSQLHRPRHLLLISVGFLVAALTLVVLLTIPAGVTRLAGATGMPNIVVISAGSGTDEAEAPIPPDVVSLIGTLPGIAENAAGKQLVAPQFLVRVKARRRDGVLTTLLVRGVPPEYWDMVGQKVRVVSGGAFVPGKLELLAGREAAHGLVGLDTGSHFSTNGILWDVAGVFSAGDSLWESEVLADVSSLQGAFNVPTQITSVWVQLASPGELPNFLQAMHGDPRFAGVTAVPQHEFYSRQLQFLLVFVRIAVAVVAVILGLGAALAIGNSLSMAVAARTREIAIMRAVGFPNFILFLAMLTEVVFVGVLCAITATGIGAMLLGGRDVASSLAGQGIHFKMVVSGSVFLSVVLYAALLGVVSGIPSLWSISNKRLVDALRAE